MNPTLCTRQTLADDLARLGVQKGDTLILHSSLSSLGWVCGGAETVVLALLDTIGNQGTLVAPAHSGDNSDPAEWKHPPAPKEWHSIIRASMPPYDPRTTRTRGMGVIAETIRTWPGTVRSAHPQTSFVAVGPNAADLMLEHALDCRLGERSPLARLEAAGARVLLLGVGFECCTAFHLAEYRLEPAWEDVSFAINTARGREWVTVQDVKIADDGFDELGVSYERKGSTVVKGKVGGALARLFGVQDAVAYAQMWFRSHRPTVQVGTTRVAEGDQGSVEEGRSTLS